MRAPAESRNTDNRSGLRRALRGEETNCCARRSIKSRAKGRTALSARLDPSRRDEDLQICRLVLFAEFGEYGRIQFALRNLNPCVEAFGRVFREDRHFTPGDDLTVIDFLIHVMHGTAGYGFACDERLPPC